MANKTISNNDNSLREFNNRNKKSNKHHKNKNKNSGHNKHDNNNNNSKHDNNDNNSKHNNNNNNSKNNNNNNSNYHFNHCYKPCKILTYNIKIGEGDFCLSSESLNRDAPNFFTAAFFGYFSESKTTGIFIERDPIYFSMIVRYLRGYEVDWPINDKISMNNLLADVKYYGFERLQTLLEEIYERNFPENVIPWKILTYASESIPVVIINIKDIELVRWNSHSLIYDINPILKNKKSLEKDDQDGNNSNDNASDITLVENNNNDNVTNNDVPVNAAADNNVADNENNDQNNAENIIEPNPDKGLYRLEIHGKDALATVTSNNNNGVKFENFTLKDSEEDKVFRKLTEPFRTAEGSLTLTPSLKLPFLKDACVEIDGSKYYTCKDLSSYFGVTTKSKPLYFEEIVIRIDDGAFLMRARAWTTPFYYASQPFIHPVRSRKI